MTPEGKQKNVFGETIRICCENPITGFFRDGFCHTDERDEGIHTVCVSVTKDFLEFSLSRGNDLSTPRPEFGFPGLKEGDSWCVCAGWYAKAVEAGKGCPVFLKKTHEKTLKLISIEALKKHAIDLS